MASASQERSAAALLIDSLAAAGVARMFCVPGESYLAALDAFYDRDDIDVITCAHESGAGYMALAQARLTGDPGVAFVSRGPGATNASIALHAAGQDGMPLILFVGDVAHDEAGRGAFQEVDYSRTFSDLAKAVLQPQQGQHLSRVVARAWQLATADTPGPVVVVLPEDMLSDRVNVATITPRSAARAAVDAEQVEQAAALIAQAERPLLIAGGQIHSPAERAALERVAEQWHLPVLGAFRQQEVFPNDHRCWAGQVGFVMPRAIAEATADADLILAVGTRLGDISTQGYTFPAAPTPSQKLIHVYPEAAAIGRNIQPDLGVVADSGAFLDALAERAEMAHHDAGTWLERATAGNRELMRYQPLESGDGVDFGRVVDAVGRHASADCVFSIDAGNFSSWVQRYLVVGREQRLLGSASGAMGGGVPAGVAAALAYPKRMVVVFVGDGGALMTGSEIATAAQYGVDLKVIVARNKIYGTIRGHQEKQFPGRAIGTDLASPDFSAWGRAFGLAGHRISADEQVDAVIGKALATPGAAVIHVDQRGDRISAYA